MKWNCDSVGIARSKVIHHIMHYNIDIASYACASASHALHYALQYASHYALHYARQYAYCQLCMRQCSPALERLPGILRVSLSGIWVSPSRDFTQCITLCITICTAICILPLMHAQARIMHSTTHHNMHYNTHIAS